MNKTGADRVTVGQKARPASSEEHRLDEPALDAERVGGGGGERREEVLGARRRALLHAELASSIAPEIDASWMPTVQLQPKLMYFGRSQRVLYCSAAHPGAFQRVSSAGSPAAEWPLGRAAHASIAVGEICFPFMPRNAGSSKLSLIHCLGFFFAAIRAELRR